MDSSNEQFVTPPQTRTSRRSIGLFSNLSDKQALVINDATVNNDEEERRERNKFRVLDLHRQTLNSPGTPTDRRKSFGSGLAGLTNDQIADHYKNCIRMSSENKITVKNAFGLHLIDFLKDVIKKPGEPTNFQMASCSLDASAKIYACRVDNIHAEAYKLVGGLGAMDKKKSNGAAENDKDEELDDGGRHGVKKKKKTRSGKTIETNLDSITSTRIEQRPRIDPIFKKISKMSTCSDVCNLSNFLTYQLRSKDDSCRLMIGSDYCLFKPSALDASLGTPMPEHNESISVDFEKFPEIKEKLEEALKSSIQICPTFADFEFGKWDAASEGLLPKSPKQGSRRGDLAFDLNCSIEDIKNTPQDDFADDSPYDTLDPSPLESAESDPSQVEKFGAAFHANGMLDRQSIVKAVRLESIDGLSKLLSDQPSDFSYFKHNVLTAWAGPEHWKLIHSKRESNVLTERKKQAGKRSDIHLTYDDNSMKEIELGWKGLTKSTLDSWRVKAKVFPEDMHYDPKQLNCLFLKPTINIKVTVQDACEDLRDVEECNYPGDDDPMMNLPFEYDDSGGFDDDLRLCHETEELPVPEGLIGVEEGQGDAAMNAISQKRLSSTAFAAENLVQQPYKIAKIELNYDQVYKKINMRKLKEHTWAALTKTEGKKTLKFTSKEELKEMWIEQDYVEEE